MQVELVETTTDDGLVLHGAYQEPLGSPEVPYPADALLLLHGVGSNFYSSPLLAQLAQRGSQSGLTSLRVNTRGHDFVSLGRTAAGPQRQGAAYETVAHCHYDIAAWLRLLGQRGAARIAIIGHSLGAVKALHAVSSKSFPAATRVVAISPPRLSFAAFEQGPRKTLFAKNMARAQAHVADGKPETLMRVTYPFPLLITAATFLEKYGPAEPYNLLKFASRLPCPTLITFGQQELESGSPAFAGLPQALENLSRDNTALQTLTIAGANHLYDGYSDTLATNILNWLADSVLPGR